jgi:hypothetical protein
MTFGFNMKDEDWEERKSWSFFFSLAFGRDLVGGVLNSIK